MSDLRATFILRATLLVIVMAGALIATSIVDVAINKTLLHFGWPVDSDSRIEGIVFVVVLYRVVWSWLKRRVWIGSVTFGVPFVWASKKIEIAFSIDPDSEYEAWKKRMRSRTKESSNG